MRWRALLSLLILTAVSLYPLILLPSLDQPSPIAQADMVYSATLLEQILRGDNNTGNLSPPPQGPPDESLWLTTTSRPPPTGKIPRIINKLFFQKNGRFNSAGLPDDLRQAHESWRDLNPGYNLRYFNLVDARRYLATHFHPTFLRTFDCIEAFAGKADFFRIALLYRDGGYHSDWKQVCLVPGILDDISAQTDFFAAIDLGFAYALATRSCAANAFVGSVPRHPIAARYLELAMRNVQASSYPGNTLLATGPCLFGNAIRIIDPTFGREGNGTKYGTYENNHFYYRNRTIIQHKCCGDHLLPWFYGQDWDGGNNYNILFNEKRYYCQDAMMIFET